MNTWAALLIAVSLVVSQTPPRDHALNAKPGSSVISGRVTSGTSNQPLQRVRITLTGSSGDLPAVVTDTSGAFEITNVPSGTYHLTAARSGYLTMQYGQRQPREKGRTINISEGAHLDGVNLTLFRGGALAGSIRDESGELYQGIRVEALELRYVRGRRIPVQAAAAITNDIGQFRLSGLEPGLYLLRASATDTWQSDDGRESYAYAPTYFPGVVSFSEAQRVTLSLGQELTALDFRPLVGRTASLKGKLQNRNGEPIRSQTVHLDRVVRGIAGALGSFEFGATAKTDASGSFEFRDLAPGEYVAYSGDQIERASQPIALNDGELLHILLTPHRSTTILGSIVTGGGAPSFQPSRLRVTAIPIYSESTMPPSADSTAATVTSQWTFQVNGVDGQYLFRVDDMPDDWVLDAVRFRGQDITDAPLKVSPGAEDISGLQIVLGRQRREVAGQVVGRDGTPTADATVIVFAENAERWTVGSRFVKAARPDDAGRFSIRGLPPGRYCAVAKDFVPDGEWENPEFLASVAGDSHRFELVDNQAQTLVLTLSSSP